MAITGSTSGTATIVTPAVAGTPTITLPIVTGTLATLAGTETLTNKTLTSPTLTTPALGTPASADFTTIAATQAQQETGSAVTAPVTPGRQQYHPSAAKAWVEANMDGTSAASYNVSSLTDIGAGRVGVNWGVDFSSTAYCVVATTKIDPVNTAASTFVAQIENSAFAAGLSNISCLRMSDFTSQDVNQLMVAAYGDQS